MPWPIMTAEASIKPNNNEKCPKTRIENEFSDIFSEGKVLKAL